MRDHSIKSPNISIETNFTNTTISHQLTKRFNKSTVPALNPLCPGVTINNPITGMPHLTASFPNTSEQDIERVHTALDDIKHTTTKTAIGLTTEDRDQDFSITLSGLDNIKAGFDRLSRETDQNGCPVFTPQMQEALTAQINKLEAQAPDAPTSDI